MLFPLRGSAPSVGGRALAPLQAAAACASRLCTLGANKQSPTPSNCKEPA